jgi:transcriptional regulator with XRE-family HTH domain
MNEIERESKAFQKSISQRIREVRGVKGWTLDKLADVTGLSKGYLSQIENCDKVPTINTLTKISFGFGMDVKTLITGEQNDIPPAKCTVVRSRERERAIDPRFASAHIYESVTHKKRNRTMDAYVITFGPELPKDYMVHEGEELVFALEGRHEMIYDGQSMIIEPGDCIYFESNRPHNARSLDNRPAKVLVVFPRH